MGACWPGGGCWLLWELGSEVQGIASRVMWARAGVRGGQREVGNKEKWRWWWGGGCASAISTRIRIPGNHAGRPRDMALRIEEPVWFIDGPFRATNYLLMPGILKKKQSYRCVWRNNHISLQVWFQIPIELFENSRKATLQVLRHSRTVVRFDNLQLLTWLSNSKPPLAANTETMGEQWAADDLRVMCPHKNIFIFNLF